MSARETKEKILKCTTELILERGGDIGNVTIRTIAARAGIGVGLTNHYFSSKEQLVEECIESVFSELFKILEARDPKDDELGGDEPTRRAARIVLDFLIKNEAIAKAALVRDVQNPMVTDYTAKLTDAFAYAMVDRRKFEEIENNDRMTERMKEQFKEHIVSEQKLKAFMIMSSIKEALIRREVLLSSMHIDLKDDEERSGYIDSLMELLY
ncbi:MAG: TetR/AcrR family transcriptional regulator [Lachnospiraceae bacterium]|nr:TetR/AcrR family transcriptional regulator [Lachnospiraceae bacterium]